MGYDTLAGRGCLVTDSARDAPAGALRHHRGRPPPTVAELACRMAALRAIARWFDPRRRLIAVVLAGWIVLVIVGAGDDSGESGWVGLPDLSDVVAAVVLLAGLAGLVMIVLMRPGVRVAAPRRTGRQWRALIALAVAAVLISFAFGRREPPEDVLEVEPSLTELEVGLGEGDAGADETDDGGMDGGDITVLLIAAGLAIGVLWWSARRQPSSLDPSREERRLEQDLAPAVEQASTVLLHGSDPRAAVLAAYAALEQALAERGDSREPAETPTEHLARVLEGAPVIAAPAVRLGELYELARFSDRPITGDDQRRAANELDRARRDLAGLVDGPR